MRIALLYLLFLAVLEETAPPPLYHGNDCLKGNHVQINPKAWYPKGIFVTMWMLLKINNYPHQCSLDEGATFYVVQDINKGNC